MWVLEIQGVGGVKTKEGHNEVHSLKRTLWHCLEGEGSKNGDFNSALEHSRQLIESVKWTNEWAVMW